MSSPPPVAYLTVRDAARALGLEPAQLEQLLDRGALSGVAVGAQRLVVRREVEALQATPLRPSWWPAPARRAP